ncbi:type I-E CRISPR-associated protein Cas6/Cse3/CasE [Actinoplanes sp. NBRC 101535]|uniref:type I-E CRISPR-associated protein Cas6/Cse3/CasE n=1 Tax=Actinoplanes sp. NBRC 101535 TaxID=3032196 RepID=UPI0024A0F472|nr:type I-E CRISPR-associated protein Cas6/Cse3/CasE [Actinoplanes sp. NBRC 101535]GLY03975.1 CRISPR-associated endoribonuclease Cse3 [Actinoplanes sp. NBRC 101535]
MPYLSRIWLNPLRTETQAYLRNPRAVHAATLGGFSEPAPDERVLWRLESAPGTEHRLQLVVLTRHRPSWQHIVDRAGWPDSEEPQILVMPYEAVLAAVAVGREFSFRLKANTVGSARNPDKPSVEQKERLARDRPRGVRVPHRTAAHQWKWLTTRLDKWGFEPVVDDQGIPAVQLSSRDRVSFRKGGGDQVVLQTATFNGLVRITDPEAARSALLNGVGPGKAYGMGLITIAPPRPRSGT